MNGGDTWKIARWVWRLEAPLFIGEPPAGSLNRCRPYVPARTMHGALAARFARLKAADAPAGLPDYGKLGYELGNRCRFTYLYPAERTDDDYQPWLPTFKEKEGLIWTGSDKNPTRRDREFRRRLLDTRPGVGVDPTSDTAADGLLRETECLGPWWRPEGDGPDASRPVFLVGYVFLKNGSFQNCLKNCSALFLGGDTRYGLGKIRQVLWEEPLKNERVFGARIHESPEGPILQTPRILGHERIWPPTSTSDRFGMQEIIGGWNIDRTADDGLCWAPGSCSRQSAACWTIDRFGYWKNNSTE